MSPLEELVQAASADDVPVSTLLRKLKVVAARLGTLQLEEWVDHELHGYAKGVDLPEYRAKRDSEVKGSFGGPFGARTTNAPIASSLFPENFRHLFRIEFRQAIAELERLAQAPNLLAASWAADMVAYTNRLIEDGDVTLYEGMFLQEAHHVISPGNMAVIVDTVRTRILDLALSLEVVEPRAGEPNTPARDLERVEQIVLNIFGGNVAVASTAVRQQNIAVEVGNRQQLYEALQMLGIEPTSLAELDQALDLDAAADEGGPRKGIGPRVKEWAGGLAIKGSSTAAKGAAGAAGALVLKVLAEYFGVGD